MASLDEDLRTYLLSIEAVRIAVSGRIHFGHVPEGTPKPFLWLGQSSSSNEDALDDATGEGPFRTSYDVECYAGSYSAAKAISQKVNDCCRMYRGTMGSRRCQGMFVDTVSADYVPRALGGDTGIFWHAFGLEVVA